MFRGRWQAPGEAAGSRPPWTDHVSAVCQVILQVLAGLLFVPVHVVVLVVVGGGGGATGRKGAVVEDFLWCAVGQFPQCSLGRGERKKERDQGAKPPPPRYRRKCRGSFSRVGAGADQASDRGHGVST